MDDGSPRDDGSLHKDIVADPGQRPLRVDRFLMNRLDGVSRNRVQNAIRDGLVTVNDDVVKPNHKVKAGDVVRVEVPRPSDRHNLEPQDIPLRVIFEDDHVLVIDKPVGLVVHPGVGNPDGTLVNALLHHLDDVPAGEDPSRAGLVHRLDKDTSGVMVVAKTAEAMTDLARQFFERTIHRRYMALVWGNLDDDEGTIEGNIGRDPRHHILYTVFPHGDQGKHAVTHYRVIERFAYVTLVECRLETGRTHQIRVHMRHIGHTLFNDARYGGDAILKGTVYSKYKQFVGNCFTLLPTQALHARELGFRHPATGEDRVFESPVPENFEAVLEKWRRFTTGMWAREEG